MDFLDFLSVLDGIKKSLEVKELNKRELQAFDLLCSKYMAVNFVH